MIGIETLINRYTDGVAMIVIPSPALWSVLAAAVANFIVSGFLHGVVFKHVAVGKAKKIVMGTDAIVAAVVGTLLMNYALGVAVVLFGAHGFVEGMQVGLVLWIGLIAPLQIAVKYANGQAWKTLCVNAFCMFASLVVACGILAAW